MLIIVVDLYFPQFNCAHPLKAFKCALCKLSMRFDDFVKFAMSLVRDKIATLPEKAQLTLFQTVDCPISARELYAEKFIQPFARLIHTKHSFTDTDTSLDIIS